MAELELVGIGYKNSNGTYGVISKQLHTIMFSPWTVQESGP